MSEYDNELRGVLFKVPEDKRSAKGPLYRGECEIQGQKYRISAWIQKSAAGRTYMSLSFSEDDGEYDRKRTKAKKNSQAPLERDDSGTRVEREREREPGEEEVDDSIPF